MDKLYFQSVVDLMTAFAANRERFDASSNLKTTELKELGSIFENNVFRLQALARLPHTLIGTSLGIQAAYSEACESVFGVSDPEDIGTVEEQIKLAFKMNETLAKGVDERTPQRIDLILSKMIEMDVPITTTAFQTIFHNMLIGAWTALEALATDLWVKAVNLRPQSLGLIAMKSQKRRKDSDEESAEPASKGKPQAISVDMLAKYKFDLKNRIGYFCWRERKFDFNSLDGLRHAYKTVFGDDWFEGKWLEDASILEALRHVLVHRGGIVDEAFQERVKKHAEFSKLELGKPLEVNGMVVFKYINAGVLFATLLLNKADEWLQTNPT